MLDTYYGAHWYIPTPWSIECRKTNCCTKKATRAANHGSAIWVYIATLIFVIRNCIVIRCGIRNPKHIVKLSCFLSGNIRLALELCNTVLIVTRTSLVAAVGVPELAQEPSLKSDLRPLETKGRLGGGSSPSAFTQRLGKTSGFSWCAKPYGHRCMSIIKVASSEQWDIRFAPSRFDATAMLATFL